ncbi:hypothetical protein RG47T_0193 [Mucilaginibacter polytrichastri]|uniref:Uncharacterized protein n=1 Tax=Mucilaginibacter polytrichastri TaxID=1302689 RepID=A0A1Q5ZSL1_9SPHI|nr:hypothetical protein RG47T_0193 [Mucilaginibacter polytrichastri]
MPDYAAKISISFASAMSQKNRRTYWDNLKLITKPSLKYK